MTKNGYLHLFFDDTEHKLHLLSGSGSITTLDLEINENSTTTPIPKVAGVDARVGGEEGRIDNFLIFIHENWPEHAEIESITVEEKEYEEDIMSIEDFSRVLSASQLSKIVQTGLGMFEMQKQALGKHDQTLEKQDQMLTKQDETNVSIRSGVDETREFRTETQQNFANLDTKYGKIAENMARILEELKEERKEYRVSIEKLVTAILESKRGD